MTSLCAVHAERPATGVCERCGAFGCVECLSLSGVLRLCANCRARTGAGLPSLKQRGTWAMPFVWATGVLGVLVSVSSFGLDVSDEAEPTPQLFAAGCVGILYLPVFVTAIVLFCRWFHALIRHAHARNRSLDTTPAAAVGAFFIPFLNLVRPYGIAKNVASTEAGVSAVGVWQALWLMGNIASNVGTRLDDKSVGVAGNVIALAGSVLILAAAWACGRVVKELTASTEVEAGIPPAVTPSGS